ncbi:MAG: T9SS type A sorting domain-containing protein [FCB group bacterium]|jgi:WD40 repeat protein
MKTYLLLFIILFTGLQTTEAAVTFDTVWMKNTFPGICHFACFSTDTTKIYASMDSTIYILDMQNGNIIDSMEKAPSTVTGYTSLSFNGNRFASTLYENYTIIWDVSSKKIIKTFQYDSISEIDYHGICALSPDGRYYIGDASSTFKDFYGFKGEQSKLFVYDLNADKLVTWLDNGWNQTRSIQYITFSPDGKYFVIAAAYVSPPDGDLKNGILAKYTVFGWQEQKVLERNSDTYYEYLSYSRDGKYIAGTKPEGFGSSYIWDMAADTLYRTYSFAKLGQCYHITNFSPDNQFLLFGGGGFGGPDSLRTLIWDFVNDTSVYHSNMYSGTNFQFSKNNIYLLVNEGTDIYLLTPNWNKTSVEETNANNNSGLQIIPNPASETMTISYNLSHSGNVRLCLFNQLGQEVAMLKNEWQEAGKQDFRFMIDDFRLNTGVYFVRLQAGSEVRNQKLLITN